VFLFLFFAGVLALNGRKPVPNLLAATTLAASKPVTQVNTMLTEAGATAEKTAEATARQLTIAGCSRQFLMLFLPPSLL